MSLTQINKAGLDEIALDHVFTIGASGNSAYTFQGEGLNGTVNNPTLYLTRGKTYRFENGSGGHPIRIQSTSGASGTQYNTGVTNNATAGTVIVEVQHDAPDVLYYQCTSHAAMNGVLYITGALADGGVTTAKLADNAVTNAKIADNTIAGAKISDSQITAAKLTANSVTTAKIADLNVTTAKIASNAITTGTIMGSAVTTAKIATGAVTTNKIADNQITTAKIVDQAVTTAKLANSAVDYGKLADGAVLTAKIADGNVTTAKIADQAVNADKITNGGVNTAKLADQSVTLAKLVHGTSSNDGKFLRANNGADPSYETITLPTIQNPSSFTGNASTTAFTINSGHTVNTILVVYNGVILTPTTDYTVSGTTMTMQFTPPTNAQIVVRYLPI